MDNPLLQTISEIDWKSVTSFVNTAGFLAYSLDEYTFSNDPRLKKNERDALTYSSILLASQVDTMRSSMPIDPV